MFSRNTQKTTTNYTPGKWTAEVWVWMSYSKVRLFVDLRGGKLQSGLTNFKWNCGKVASEMFYVQIDPTTFILDAFPGNLNPKLCLSAANKQLKGWSQRLLHHIMRNISARKHKELTRNSSELWETVKQGFWAAKVVKTTVTTLRFCFKGLLFVVEGLNVAIHIGHFYPGQYFISPSERTFRFLFLWFGPGRAVGRGEQPNPNVDAQLGRLSTECPDQTKAGREIQPFIYIRCGFACCVLDFQTPGGYSVWGWRQMDGFPLTYLKEPSGLMSDPYVLIECEVLMCGPSQPCTIIASKTKRCRSILQNRLGLRTDCPPVKYLTYCMMVCNDSSRESMKSERFQNHRGRLCFYEEDDLTTVCQGMEPI